jgi:hypothetical protein
MSGYKYIKLSYSNDMIEVITTDNGTMGFVIEEIGKIVPTCMVQRRGEYSRIYNLPGNERQIGTWIIQLLCKLGWEPSANTGPIDRTFWHHLRRRYETHEF